MHSEDIAISVRNLKKDYRLFDNPGARIKQFLSLGLRQYHREFTALSNVSFDIRKGETVGIIGHNGSGKSTLLQLICGILKPTSGTVVVNGRVSALLELGSGFNPEFTGRENVYFQGAVMGFTTAQIDERFDDIEAFADIGEFIDQPVRMYSSGMFVRLAFAVAVSTAPDILVVDEALAVGDAVFQAKCLRRVDAIRQQGGTILIVTHAVEQVAHHCDRVLLLDHGRLLADGDTATTLTICVDRMRHYAEHESDDASSKKYARDVAEHFATHPAYNPKEVRWGDRQATITEILIIQDGHENPGLLTSGRVVEVRFRVAFRADVARPIYGLALKSSCGVIVFTTNSRELLASSRAPQQNNDDIVQVGFGFTPFLGSGEYRLSVGVASEKDGDVVPNDRRYDAIFLRIEDSGAVKNPSCTNLFFGLARAT